MSTLSQFPSQKKTFAEKNPLTSKGKDFYKECIDASIQIVDYADDLGIRTPMLEKRINYDLVNNILDPVDVDRIVNPWRIAQAESPIEIRNYPLVKPKLDLLTGEELRRRFNYLLVNKNPDAVTVKSEEFREQFFQYVKSVILDPNEPDEEKIKAQLKKLEQDRRDIKDIREEMGTQILNYYYYTYKYKSMFNRGFEDALIAGEEIYTIDIQHDEVIVKKENPNNVLTFGLSDSNYIEHAQIIIIDGYRSLGQILDTYHDDLDGKDLKDLEDGSYMTRSPEAGLNSYLTVPENYYEEALDEKVFIMPNNTLINAYAGGFDTLGNIRETKVFWRSMRKIGILKYFDEQGIEQKKFVDEYYPVNEDNGEDVKWEWVTEWLGGVRLGVDIYVKCKPIPRVTKSMSNPSECVAPVVGTIYNTNTNQAMSLVSYVKPFQYLYNAIMYNNEMAIIKNRGIVPRLPMHLIPEGYTLEDWIYYFNVMGFALEDSFRESNKGIATGKLAGNFQNSSQPINASNVDYIKENIMMLNIIKQQVDDITGISPQRQGAIEQRELVQNVERSVTQSSIITEKWFALHDNTKIRVMEAVLDMTRVAWKNKKFQRQYVMDDMTQALLDFDAEVFSTSQLGLYLSDAPNDMEVFNSLKQLGMAALQAGKARLSDVVAILMSTTQSAIKRRIEESEDKADQAAAEAQKAELASRQQPDNSAIENRKLDQIDRKIDLMQKQIEDNARKAEAEIEVKNKKIESDKDKAAHANK